MAEAELKELPPEFPIPEDVRQIFQKLERKEKTRYEKFCRYSNKVFGRLTRGYRLSPQTERELKEAGIHLTGEEWYAGTLASLVLPLLPCLVMWLLSGGWLSALYLPIIGFLSGGLAMMIFQVYPAAVAESRKTEAHGTAITTIMLLSFSLFHRPDLRGATVYAADSSEGKLAEDLRKGLFELDEGHRYESARHLLTAVANRWGEIDESVRQSIFDILRSTGTRDEAARILDISKAPSRVLEGAESQLSKRLARLVMPTLAFLTFGALAIIATIGLSPVMSIIGVQFVDLKFFIGMAFLLIITFLGFTLYMERQRPTTIQVTVSGKSQLIPVGLRVGKKTVPAWALSLVIFFLLGWPGFLYLGGIKSGVLGAIAVSFSTLWLVWGAAASIAVYSYLYVSSRKAERERERKRFADWANALNTLGSRMLDGKPAPAALIETSELTKGSPLSPELELGGRRMQEFGIELDEALPEKKNPLVAGFLRIISRIRRDNEAVAGRACMMAADFLRTLHQVERRFRDRIDEAMGNLWLVALVLIPVVCAMAVWVMDFMSGMKYTVFSQLSAAGVMGIPLLIGAMDTGELALLRLVMGMTAVALSIIIGRYIARIRAPGDSVELWVAIMKASIASVVIFTLTSILLRALMSY